MRRRKFKIRDVAAQFVQSHRPNEICLRIHFQHDALKRPSNMTVLPISGLLAETIMNVFEDDSVSAIFGGENQLF